MPVNVGGNHWALLVADVRRSTVGIVDTLPSPTHAATYRKHWKKYMAVRSARVGELGEWKATTYSGCLQIDGHSCGVLALMNAEAIVSGVSLQLVDSSNAAAYCRYIKSRLILSCRPHDDHNDDVCDLPVCLMLKSKQPARVQCNQCSRWFHKACVSIGKTHETYVCVLCIRSPSCINYEINVHYLQYSALFLLACSD